MLKYAVFCPFILLISIYPAASYAQKYGQPLIDSLNKELYKQKEDTNKVKVLDELSFDYSYTDPDAGIKYGQQELELANKLTWKKGIAKANVSMGVNYWAKSDFSRALSCYAVAQNIYENIGYKLGAATVAGNIGIIYDEQSDYGKALEYYFKALKINEEIGDKKGMARAMGNIAIVHHKQGDYPGALSYYFNALKIDEEIGNKRGAGIVTGNIGSIYNLQLDYQRALEYYLKALKMDEEIGEKNTAAKMTGNIATVYDAQRNDTLALAYYLKALNMNEELGDKSGVADNTRNIGIFYAQRHSYSQALPYLFKALKTDQEIGDKDDEAKCLAGIGEDYLGIVRDMPKNSRVPGAATYVMPYRAGSQMPAGRTALLHKAIEYIDSAITIDREIGSLKELETNYLYLAGADSLQGDYKQSLNDLSHYIIYKDSIYSKENSVQIARLEYQQKAATDSLKSAQEKHLAELKYRHQRHYTYLGLMGISALMVFLVIILRNSNRITREKKRSDNLLLNILPSEVAEELKKTGSSEPRDFDNVTILFTDFVSFTQASEKMKAKALIAELDACFKVFDGITSKYNVEKIKTIGDAYLAVSGLPTPDPEHAENIVRAAIEINAFMQDRVAKLGNSTFEIRIGIHSGSVAAGIVGVKKFAYDIWGDTVNTAARMEQNSEAGKINISATTYELVKDKFACEYRGEIDAKGKGAMKMYYVG